MAHAHRGALRVVGFGMTFTAVAVSSAIGAQTPAQLDSAFSTLREAADIVGMSAALLRDGAIAWTGTFGVRQSGLSARVDRNTVFEAASLTEPVVAYAMLRLADRGVIDLDRPIAATLANQRLARDARHTRITPRMVLSHASGIVDGHGRGGADDTLAIAFDPGTSWGYSAEALIWLEKAIERQTGQRLSAIVRREVLEPLGMNRTALAEYSPNQPNSAMPHDDLSRPQPRRLGPTSGLAATGLRTTAEDYAKFVIAVMEGRRLEPETARQLFTPQVETRNATEYAERPAAIRERIAWGFGWGLERRDDGLKVWHWGDGGYSKSFVMMDPRTRQAVVYFTNSQTGLSIMSAVVSLVFPGRDYTVSWLDYWPYDLPSTVLYRSLVRAGRASGAPGAAGEYESRRGQSATPLPLSTVQSAAVALGVLGSAAAGDTLLALAERDHPDSVGLPIARGDLALVEMRDVSRALGHFERAVSRAPADSTAQSRAQWARETSAIRGDVIQAPAAQLTQLVGEYGQHRIAVANARLHYQDATGISYRLFSLPNGVFAVDGMPIVRIRFGVSASGKASTLVRLYWDGDRFEDARTR